MREYRKRIERTFPPELFMSKKIHLGVLALLFTAGVTVVFGQEAVTSTTIAAPVPHVVRYSGTADVPSGHALSVKFALYENQTGGDALWSESQQVTTGESGKYSVLLGAATENGLPQTVFSSAQAKWLGITIGDGQEAARTVLVATPYSLKASDAETLGGHPASDFALKKALPATGTDITQINVGNGVTGGGTGPTVTLGLSSTYLETLGNEIYPQLGGTNKLTGTNTYTAGKLLVGTSPVLSASNLLAASPVTVTASGGNVTVGLSDSALLTLGNGVYAQLGAANTFSKAQTFQSAVSFASGQTFPGTVSLSGNNTFTGSDTFSKAITFASGQTFPGTGAGTITGITTTSPLSGSGTSGSVALSLNTSSLETTLNGVYPQLSGSNTFSGANTISKAISFASGQTFPGSATLSGNDAFTGMLSITGSSSSEQFAVTDSDASGSAVGVYSTMSAGAGFGVVGVGSYGIYGQTTAASSLVLNPTGIYGFIDTRYTYSPGYTPFAIWGDNESASGIGVYGTSNGGDAIVGQASATYNGVAGYSSSGDGVFGSSGAGDGVYGETDATGGPAGLYGNSTTTSIGSDNFPGIGVSGNANGPSAYGVYGNSTSSTGYGIYGVGNTGVYGSSSTGNGVYGNSSAQGESGVTGHATNGNGVYGKTSYSTGFGTYGGNTSTDGGDGVRGITASDAGFGVHAIQIGASKLGAEIVEAGSGFWADTNQGSSEASYGALLATADGNFAGQFVNSSNQEPTIGAVNEGDAGTGTIVPVIAAAGRGGACGINSNGDVTCSGRIQTAVPLADKSQVEVYSVQSSENWFEDFGSAKLFNGHVTVAIDPKFAQIVNTGVQYHVFLTPSGNCRGLYVASRSASGFEVRELGDGGSTVEFDYRIVAKRNGHETERLADATAEMHSFTAGREQWAARKLNRRAEVAHAEPKDMPPPPVVPPMHPAHAPTAVRRAARPNQHAPAARTTSTRASLETSQK